MRKQTVLLLLGALVFSHDGLAAQVGPVVAQVVTEEVANAPNLDQAPVITPEYYFIPRADTPALGASNAVKNGVVIAATSGAWSANGGGPTIYSKNLWYRLVLSSPITLPPNSTITSVVWS